MITIWKFPLTERLKIETLSVPTLEYPMPLHVGLDPGGILCAWFMVNTEMPKKTTRLFCAGTGQPFPDKGDWEHVGSVNEGVFRSNDFTWYSKVNVASVSQRSRSWRHMSFSAASSSRQ